MKSVGAVGFVVGAPMVHVAHGRGWASLASFGIHLLGGLGAVGTLWSGDACDDPEGTRADCLKRRDEESDVVKPVVILATAAVFDAVVLGWDREKIPVPNRAVSVGLAPSRRGGLVGVFGSF